MSVTRIETCAPIALSDEALRLCRVEDASLSDPKFGGNCMNASERRIRVLIADDHPLMRDGLRSMMQLESNLEIAAQAADGAECIAKFREHRPDVTLVDLQMPKVDGLGVMGTLRAEFPEAHFVVLTTYAGDARITSALKLGARSYLLKTARRTDIIRALHDAVRGRTFLEPDVAKDVDTHRGTPERPVLVRP
jgi:DNA-binding NarL/FixJ family response regulator